MSLLVSAELLATLASLHTQMGTSLARSLIGSTVLVLAIAACESSGSSGPTPTGNSTSPRMGGTTRADAGASASGGAGVSGGGSSASSRLVATDAEAHSSGGVSATGGVLAIAGSMAGSGGSLTAGGAGGGTSSKGGSSTGGTSQASGGKIVDAAVDANRNDGAMTTGPTDGSTTITPDASRPDVDPNTLPAITLWLAGDSTVQDNGPGKLPEGWGTDIGQFFTSKVTVVDKAIGGRNVRTFMYSDTGNTTETSTWASMKASMKPGDYFMAQFGANDSSPGSERYLTPATYETLLGEMVDAMKAKQVTPILVTPSCLQIWVSGRIDNSRLAPYVAAMIDLGARKRILVDDLNARSVEYVNALGQTAANAQIYYDNDKAHFTKAGATKMAQFVVSELKRIGSPLAAYVK